MAPIPIVKTVERQKLDPDTKAPVLDEDGQVITEKREVQVPRFRPVPVFDVSQTNGKPLPQLAQDLTGDVEQYEAFMEPCAGRAGAYWRSSPWRRTWTAISVWTSRAFPSGRV